MPKQAVTHTAAEPSSDASDAAIAEVDAETAPDENKITLTHAGVEFSFDKRHLDDVRFRRLMQQRRDAVALDWLLGEAKMNAILDAIAESSEDGIVSGEAYGELFRVIGESVGSGNS